MSLWDQRRMKNRMKQKKRAKLKKWNFNFLIISFLFLSFLKDCYLDDHDGISCMLSDKCMFGSAYMGIDMRTETIN